MGHNITAIITQGPCNRTIAAHYDLPIFEEYGYYIIAIDTGHAGYWNEKYFSK
jgi:hypothetical protein